MKFDEWKNETLKLYVDWDDYREQEMYTDLQITQPTVENITEILQIAGLFSIKVKLHEPELDLTEASTTDSVYLKYGNVTFKDNDAVCEGELFKEMDIDSYLELHPEAENEIFN